MTLYLAFETFLDFDHGPAETLYGAFSTLDKAAEALMEDGTWFDESRQKAPNLWEYQRGQDRIWYEVRVVRLDQRLMGDA